MNSSIPWESVKSLKNAAKTKQTSQRITKVKLQGLPDIHGTYHKKKPLKPIGSPWDDCAYIYLHEMVDIYGFHVGKYTHNRPMEIRNGYKT